MTDPIGALVAYLKVDTAVATLASTRIYGAELPKSEIENASNPRAIVVVKQAGGGMLGLAYQQYGDIRADVACYGSTPFNASALYGAVYDALKELRREVYASTLLHWAQSSARGTQGRDPDLDWPVVFSSWQVLAAETS